MAYHKQDFSIDAS